MQEIPLDLYYTVLIGPSQEFARHWLKGRMKSSIKKAERTLGTAAWNALRGEEADGWLTTYAETRWPNARG